MTRIVFAATLFLSAALLFIVQPMTGKQLLPLAGGTPAVWNTCLVFFQTALLGGYLYAYILTRPTIPVAYQAVVHVIALAAGLTLVVSFGRLAPDPDHIPDAAHVPVFGLVMGLAMCVGGPFLVLAATAPLLQKWFTATSDRDPYPLYAASNAGSLIGLFAYPFLVEPRLTLSEQRMAWIMAFAVCAGLIGLCGWRAGTPSPPGSAGGEGRGEGGWRLRDEDSLIPVLSTVTREAPLTPSPLPPQSRGEREYIRWVALAALTSSLLMSVTTHLTTDIAPVPLLWVVPLGLYLLSFIIVFAWWPEWIHRIMGRVVPMALCALAVALATRATDPPLLAAAIHLAAFTLICLLAHGELARSRPPANQLTSFYLWLSLGGMLGGLLTALLAPILFARLGPVEYPLAVVLAALVRPAWRLAQWRPRWDDLVYPLLLGAATVGLVILVPRLLGDPPRDNPADALLDRILRGGLVYGLPAAAAFALAWRPVRFALALAAVLLATTLDPGRGGETLAVSRDFFGTLRVTRDSDGFIRLWHGTTQHGMQRADDHAAPAPLLYYHRRGPLGRYFAAIPPNRLRRVGVVGLGCGATAAYAHPNQDWTFYEIAPGVVRLARDDRFFTYLSTCRSRSLDVVLGDARRQLEHAPDASYDLLVLDAFSSDAIPVHLLTREAFALYLSKLAAHGVLAFHLSNRYLDLPPLVARLAADADPSLVVKLDEDGAVSEAERADGKAASAWLFVARHADDLGQKRVGLSNVRPLDGPAWTDDFSNVLGVWKRSED